MTSPTAEQFLEEFKAKKLILTMTSKDIQEYTIEFAKLHVEAALKEALESIPYDSSDIATYEELEDAVLNSYPLTNIK
jgi:hypothetical protein